MRLGPEGARLVVRTFRQGMAAVAGHDLVIEVTRWEAELTETQARLTADPRSLEVREGLRGARPLTGADRAEIARTIERRVLGAQPIAFASTSLESAGEGRLRVRGDLTLAGATRPVAFEVERAGERIRARAVVRQSAWGIRPYSAMLGALKVRDEVEVELEA